MARHIPPRRRRSHRQPQPRSGHFKWYGLSGTGYTAPVAAGGTAGPSSTPTSSKRIGPAMAKRVPSAWYHAATQLSDGSDLNRVRPGEPPHGQPPHGNVIGRG